MGGCLFVARGRGGVGGGRGRDALESGCWVRRACTRTPPHPLTRTTPLTQPSPCTHTPTTLPQAHGARFHPPLRAAPPLGGRALLRAQPGTLGGRAVTTPPPPREADRLECMRAWRRRWLHACCAGRTAASGAARGGRTPPPHHPTPTHMHTRTPYPHPHLTHALSPAPPPLHTRTHISWVVVQEGTCITSARHKRVQKKTECWVGGGGRGGQGEWLCACVRGESCVRGGGGRGDRRTSDWDARGGRGWVGAQERRTKQRGGERREMMGGQGHGCRCVAVGGMRWDGQSDARVRMCGRAKGGQR